MDRLFTFTGLVHINADFSSQASDHDPLLAYFAFVFRRVGTRLAAGPPAT